MAELRPSNYIRMCLNIISQKDIKTVGDAKDALKKALESFQAEELNKPSLEPVKEIKNPVEETGKELIQDKTKKKND